METEHLGGGQRGDDNQRWGEEERDGAKGEECLVARILICLAEEYTRRLFYNTVGIGKCFA